MTELSVVGGKRRYTRRQKVTAVIAAEMTSAEAAAKTTGIPRTSILYWMEKPEFVALRQKTREELADESKALAHKALGEIERRLPEFEPRDLTILYGVLTDKSQLLAGQATSRSETRDLTHHFDDHELDGIEEWLHEVAKERLGAD